MRPTWLRIRTVQSVFKYPYGRSCTRTHMRPILKLMLVGIWVAKHGRKVMGFPSIKVVLKCKIASLSLPCWHSRMKYGPIRNTRRGARVFQWLLTILKTKLEFGEELSKNISTTAWVQLMIWLLIWVGRGFNKYPHSLDASWLVTRVRWNLLVCWGRVTMWIHFYGGRIYCVKPVKLVGNLFGFVW